MTMPPAIPPILTWGPGGTFLSTGDGALAGNLSVVGHLDAVEQAATPAAPAAGRYRLYPKADSHWYSLDPQGIELDLTAGGPPGPVGPQGAQGAQGAAGTGIQMMGSVATQANLPPAPAPQGNAYIVQADNSLWIADATGTFVSGGAIQGPPGAQGPMGPAGYGIAPGGTQGQYLVKNSATDYDTAWATVPGVTQAAADLRYLQLSGGTLTGQLTLAADPTVALGAATKQYVDAHAATSLGAVTTIPATTVPPAPAAPPAGSYSVYVDSSTGQLLMVDSTGAARPVGGADNALRAYVQAKFATLDPGGAPAPV